MLPIQPAQIVYLDHQDSRLYVEAIQTAGHRLWSRPLLLVMGLPSEFGLRQRAIADAANHLVSSPLKLFDLKQAPDLLWPSAAFQAAFDTDFFSLLFHLKVSGTSEEASEAASLALRCFLEDCWRVPQPLSSDFA